MAHRIITWNHYCLIFHVARGRIYVASCKHASKNIIIVYDNVIQYIETSLSPSLLALALSRFYISALSLQKYTANYSSA